MQEADSVLTRDNAVPNSRPPCASAAARFGCSDRDFSPRSRQALAFTPHVRVKRLYRSSAGEPANSTRGARPMGSAELVLGCPTGTAQRGLAGLAASKNGHGALAFCGEIE